MVDAAETKEVMVRSFVREGSAKTRVNEDKRVALVAKTSNVIVIGLRKIRHI
jgi:hypothetical protein